MRAYRRGLLRKEGFAHYPSQALWEEIAKDIRRRDDHKCKKCGATNTQPDVHHIIYLSHHGTNQKSNLITLCRACHQTEHNRIFDNPEQDLYPKPARPARTNQPATTSLPTSTLPPSRAAAAYPTSRRTSNINARPKTIKPIDSPNLSNRSLSPHHSSTLRWTPKYKTTLKTNRLSKTTKENII